jgi:hypothetical protein
MGDGILVVKVSERGMSAYGKTGDVDDESKRAYL